ncbi:magnesium-transporting ATPase (P-type) [Azospirillum agricola]|uniref:HAD-IC family P-type ATPase n=1 Tax=Azospirillum agricola TaxID=1720247 RepID=UPI001AE499BE|nr:HAD-IC family P-type ATPase [Azospirillum agricola]MBP2227985.1 magnesium-transporting ATPase (P-type) [Azospirillum agricola]
MPRDPSTVPARCWHAIDPSAVCSELRTGADGLSEREAADRLRTCGANAMPAASVRGPLRRFLSQFGTLLIRILLAAAAVTAALGHWTDAVVVLLVCVLNAGIGFLQEGRAERALDAIRGMLAPQATVLRDGRRRAVPAAGLVPGDAVLIEPGDRVPADLRLLRARGLRIDEAALTGESVAAAKSVEPVALDSPLGDRASMAFSGTLVVAGQGLGVVVATGAGTQIGRITSLLASVRTLTTPLLEKVGTLARWVTGSVLAGAALVFALGVLVRGHEAAGTLMAVVSLAVAAIPEGLPTILTVSLAVGVTRMAKRQAIIRRLPAVEALGSVSIVCSDKTGTLTRNEMTVKALATASGQYEVDGAGYSPRGGFRQDDLPLADPGEVPDLDGIARAAVLCNDACLRRNGGGWRIEGDPMEGALVVLGCKAGIDPDELRRLFPRTDIIPFEPEHRFMATLHHGHDGTAFVCVKGAPEQVLAMCELQPRDGQAELGDGTAPDAALWRSRVVGMASRGWRVLAIAWKPMPAGRLLLRFDDVEGGLSLLGLFGIADPPRDEAVAAVARCRSAGIRVKMITGDHADTARAIARDLGLANPQDVLTGSDIDRLSDEALRRTAPNVDVFARTSPEHKLRLVRAFQADGSVVAMTGDGVNDAPALKQADVGIAMGRKGTEAAKEAALMVLADDNFASIVAAIQEGRTVYDNLMKAILFLLPINGGESLGIVAAILLDTTLPITPVQILWVNMVSSIGLSMALAFEPPEAGAITRPPRPPGEPILSGFLVWRTVLVSLLFLLGIFGTFHWTLDRGASLAEARAVAVNTLVCMEVFYLFSVRYLRVPSFTAIGLRGTPHVLAAVGAVVTLQLVFTHAPIMQRFFDIGAVGIDDGVAILATGAALFAVLELEKFVRRALFQRRD